MPGSSWCVPSSVRVPRVSRLLVEPRLTRLRFDRDSCSELHYTKHTYPLSVLRGKSRSAGVCRDPRKSGEDQARP